MQKNRASQVFINAVNVFGISSKAATFPTIIINLISAFSLNQLWSAIET